MIMGKFNQARCQACHSWHWALTLDDDKNIIECKCCRCQRIVPYQMVTKVIKKNGKKIKTGKTD